MKSNILIAVLTTIFSARAMQKPRTQIVQFLNQKEVCAISPHDPLSIFTQLPSDIRTHLLKILFSFSLNENNSVRNLQSNPVALSDCLLNHLIDAKMLAPLKIGNKILNYESLILTTQKNRDDLVRLLPVSSFRALIEGRTNGEIQQQWFDTEGEGRASNPRNILANQPLHIKEGLQISIRSRIPYLELSALVFMTTAVLGILWKCGVPLNLRVVLISMGVSISFSTTGCLVFRFFDEGRIYSLDEKKYV